MSTTLRELRRAVGRTVGEGLTAEATSAGSTTSIVDAIHFGAADSSHAGRVGIVSEGTAGNLGRYVRITSTDRTATSATFTPALPVATATGDIIEFYNERETGVTPKVLVDHINDAIRSVGFGNLTRAESGELDWSSDSTDGLTIPAEWNGIYGAVWEDFDNLWQTIPPADIELDHVNRVVFLKNLSRWNASGQSVKLLGTTDADTLSADSDTTTINFEFIRLQASASILLATARYRMNSVEARQDAQGLQARADAIRPKARRRPPANWVPLR